MAVDNLIIQKITRPVVLWVHPVGRVSGEIYLTPEMKDQPGELAEDVLNQDEPFLFVRNDTVGEVVFYNRASIVRAEYQRTSEVVSNETNRYQCTLIMMDGAEFHGTIQESLPKEYSRLYDYLNKKSDRFVKLFTEDFIYLVNKQYITNVLSEDG